MARFNYDDEDFQDENLFPDTENEANFRKSEEAFNFMQLDIVRREMNHRLLNRVIKMCENSSGWHNKGHKTRLKMIAECYSVLTGLLQEPEDEVG